MAKVRDAKKRVTKETGSSGPVFVFIDKVFADEAFVPKSPECSTERIETPAPRFLRHSDFSDPLFSHPLLSDPLSSDPDLS
jgi:hypothetical protein